MSCTLYIVSKNFVYTRSIFFEVQHADGTLHCVDFEFSCVGPATHDLAFAVACCGGDDAKRRALLTAYLEALGYSAERADVDRLMVDAYLQAPPPGPHADFLKAG